MPSSDADSPFPNLRSGNHKVTSPCTSRYNCIAWAAKEVTRLWWPRQFAYWPQAAPRETTLDAFLKAFEYLGYTICDTYKLESGFEKIALFVNENGTPTHAARQLPSGKWTSKLGQSFDIEHNLRDIEGPQYGKAVKYMRRPYQTP